MDLNDILNMMKNPQALQSKAEELKARIESHTATGSAGGGMVTITLNGRFEAIACVISPEALDPSDPALTADLVRAALNDALAKMRESLQAELGTGGLAPGLFGGA